MAMLNWAVIPEGVSFVLLDHDDTQVGTIEAKRAAHRLCARMHYRRRISDAMFREHWGKPLPVLCGLLYGDQNPEQALARYLAMQHEFPKHLFPYTVPVLHELRTEGLLVGVVTATIRQSLEEDWTNLGIDPASFDYSQAVEDSTVHKPFPGVYDPLRIWLREHGILQEQVLCVGDGLLDRAAAVDARFHFLGVCTGIVTIEQFEAAGAAAVPDLGCLIAQP